MNLSEQQKPSLWVRVVKELRIPAAIGFVFGIAITVANNKFEWNIDRVLTELGAQSMLDTSSGVALVIGGLLFFASFYVWACTLFPAYGIRVKIFADRQEWEDQRRLFQLSALGCFAWGAMLIVLAMTKPLGLVASLELLALLGVLAALLAYSCWKLMHEFDEFWHDLSRAMCTWAFFGAFVVGGGWSALAHLGFLPALTPLDWVSFLTVLSLVGSAIANGQRGLLIKE